MKYSNLTDPNLRTQLRDGAVGVLPTDTVYGLVCLAQNAQSVGKLYGLKNREQKPGTVIASSIEQLVALGLKARYLKAVAQFWPGQVSVVVPTDNPSLCYLDQGKGSLAVRVVDDSRLIALLDQVGPLLTSSANTPGDPPATNYEEAFNYFKETVDFYVDGGYIANIQPSTIVRIVDDAIEVLRQGAVTIKL